jgi:hypothetical protein
MARGQFIMEFMILLAVGILLGAMYLAVSNELFSAKSEEQRIEALNDIGYQVQDELLLAASVLDGYERNFTLPTLADRFDYTLTNDETSLTLASGPASVTYPLPEVTGTFQKGRNVLRKDGGLTVVPG